MTTIVSIRTAGEDDVITTDGPAPLEQRPSRFRALLDRRDRLVVLAAFVGSRVLFAILGVRYDASSLVFSSQLLDPTWLQFRLGEGIWYLHSQPPLFNLFVGMVLRWSPFAPTTSFAILYLLLGLVLVLSFHDLLCRLRVNRTVAVVATIIVCCGPTVVLFENWLSYEYPVATALVVMVDAIVRWGDGGRARWFVTAVTMGALVVLTRSLFHPLWLVVIVGLLLLHRRPSVRTMAVAAIPLVVVGAFLVKNQVLFGSPTLSSWFGYNVNKVVVSPLTDDQKGQLGFEGFVFHDPGPCQRRHPDVPVVAEPFKPTPPPDGSDPVQNFNDECLIPRYQALSADAASITKRHPTWTARNLGGATELWAVPSSLNPFVYTNRNEIGPVDEVYRRILLLDVSYDPPIAVPTAWPLAASAPDHRFHLSLTMLLATLAVCVAAVQALWRWKRRDGASLAMALGGLTVAYASVAAIVFEYGENNRIRMAVEPLTLALFTVLLTRCYRWWRARRAEQPEPTELEPAH